VATLSGSAFSSSGNTYYQNRALDTNYATYFIDHRLSCYVGVKLASGYYARPYRMRFYPRVQYSSYVNGVVFEASANGGVTYDILGSSTTAHEGWNYIDPTSNYTNKWYSRFRFRSTDTLYSRSYCYMSEIEFLGVLAHKDSVCPVAVNHSNSLHYIGNVSYGDLSYTPVIETLDPQNGTALGGTTLTVTGANFVAASSAVAPQVTISGVACEVQSYTSTTIVCVTGARDPDSVLPTSLVVYVPGNGKSISSDSSKYLYIDRWSALTSWKNQEPPIAGDLVWVPEGQVIMLDVNTPVLNSVLVEGSLYFDTQKDVTLDAYYIFVKGGLMQVGTADVPYEKYAVITLHGDRFV
jgi:hypothetical protein